MLELAAAFICFTSLLTYLNFRFIGLPPTIGVMVIALIFSVGLQSLSWLGFPGLEHRIGELLGQIDFNDLLMAPCTSISRTCVTTGGPSVAWPPWAW